MKRMFVIGLATLLVIGSAAADTYRSGSKVLGSGDSEGRLREVMGKPDRETPIETSRGGHRGYRLEYFRDGKSVQFEVVNGRIQSITQIDS